MKQKLAICKGCTKTKYIVNTKHGLCCICNRFRLFKKKLEKGIKPKRPIKKVNKHAKDNDTFYRAVWADRLKGEDANSCEECGAYLFAYSANFISHIVTKGANTALRSDIRNANILCLDCHNKWEFGSRVTMKIWAKNIETIQQLKLEYYTKKAA